MTDRKPASVAIGTEIDLRLTLLGNHPSQKLARQRESKETGRFFAT